MLQWIDKVPNHVKKLKIPCLFNWSQNSRKQKWIKSQPSLCVHLGECFKVMGKGAAWELVVDFVTLLQWVSGMHVNKVSNDVGISCVQLLYSKQKPDAFAQQKFINSSKSGTEYLTQTCSGLLYPVTVTHTVNNTIIEQMTAKFKTL